VPAQNPRNNTYEDLLARAGFEPSLRFIRGLSDVLDRF
jgi:hypothetical protein